MTAPTQLDSQIRRIARRAPLPRVGGEADHGRSFEEPDGSRQCLAEPARPSHTPSRRPFSAAAASFHLDSGLLCCARPQPWPTAPVSALSPACADTHLQVPQSCPRSRHPSESGIESERRSQPRSQAQQIMCRDWGIVRSLLASDKTLVVLHRRCHRQAARRAVNGGRLSFVRYE